MCNDKTQPAYPIPFIIFSSIHFASKNQFSTWTKVIPNCSSSESVVPFTGPSTRATETFTISPAGLYFTTIATWWTKQHVSFIIVCISPCTQILTDGPAAPREDKRVGLYTGGGVIGRGWRYRQREGGVIDRGQGWIPTEGGVIDRQRVWLQTDVVIDRQRVGLQTDRGWGYRQTEGGVIYKQRVGLYTNRGWGNKRALRD